MIEHGTYSINVEGAIIEDSKIVLDARLIGMAQHLVERAAHATGDHRSVVCEKKYTLAAKANPQTAAKDLPKRKKTQYWCPTCKVFLCIGTGDDNCFARYHSRVQHWR